MDARVRKLTKQRLDAEDAKLLVESGLDTPRKIAAASIEEVTKALGKSKKDAEAVHGVFNQGKK